MQKITLDCAKYLGEIKPMHAVNNGPVGWSRGRGNVQIFTESGIPCARLHDSSFCASYGGEFTVDVHRIFRNFDADENDPNSYDFESTDTYIKGMYENGIDIMYRLGASIEHYKKYGTYPPKDYLKWARICEHIMLHYNEGWKDGFKNAVKYWEIWNEPELNMGTANQPCWQGTFEEFLDFFVVAFRYLKERFPNYIIGGPAFTAIWENSKWDIAFFERLQKENLKIDFLSYHLYCQSEEGVVSMSNSARKMCDMYGQSQAKLILDEWNYIYGWVADKFVKSVRRIKGYYGAAFASAFMLAGQNSPVDMLMYYDARPSAYNGLFDEVSYKPIKGFYSFKYFNELYKLKNQLDYSGKIDHVQYVGASDGENVAVALTYYDYKQGKKDVEFEIELLNLKDNVDYKVEYYLTNKRFTDKLTLQKQIKKGEILDIKMSHYDVLLLKITPIR